MEEKEELVAGELPYPRLCGFGMLPTMYSMAYWELFHSVYRIVDSSAFDAVIDPGTEDYPWKKKS